MTGDRNKTTVGKMVRKPVKEDVPSGPFAFLLPMMYTPSSVKRSPHSLSSEMSLEM